MRNILIAITVVVTLPASIAAAEQPGRQKLSPTPSQEKVLPLKRDAGSVLRGLGPGFVKVEGSGTCVKVGGSVQIGAGASR